VQCALAVAGRIQSGICHINGPTLHDQAQMPFGGKAAITEFTYLRWITIEDSAHYPF
jgi:acyl-CoA reductase-like NAD-dependent aldehyde dehydrogenase